MPEAERRIGRIEEVRGSRSLISPARAHLKLDVAPSARTADGLRMLGTKLRHRIAIPGVSMSIRGAVDGARSSASTWLSFSEDLEPRATTDRIHSYRFILRSADAVALRRAWEQIQVGVKSPFFYFQPDWEGPQRRIELTARAGTRISDALTAALRQRTQPPATFQLLGTRRVVSVVPPDSPREDEAPRLSSLLEAPLALQDGVRAAASSFDIRERSGLPVLSRASGKFVLVVDGFADGPDKVKGLHRSLGILRLPRSQRRAVWSREKVATRASVKPSRMYAEPTPDERATREPSGE